MSLVKKLLPESLLKTLRPIYHGLVALAASFYFGRPGGKIIVIGVTGTAGKSSTVAMLSEILNYGGKKCGYITTVSFFDGDSEHLNKHGLSMPGGWLLQKQLAEMLKHNCQYAIVECTSEGLEQNRHLGINFDVALFTNLSRAHLESHGSFGNYQAAKGKLFRALAKLQITNYKLQINSKIQKSIGVNLDDPMSGYFLSFPAGQKFGVTFKNLKVSAADKIFQAQVLKTQLPAEFKLGDSPFKLDILGEFNIQNAALAASCANILGVELEKCAAAMANFKGVRGRMEGVPNSRGLQIIVDYGCEPASFKAALETAAQLPRNRLIHLFGATGGHRDTAKRFEFGKTSAQFADYIIVTNDDVYDSNPQTIADNIVVGIKQFALRKPQFEIVLNRRAAIAKALSIAQKDDLVLITGKGSEQFLVLPGDNRIEWDDVSVVKELLGK